MHYEYNYFANDGLRGFIGRPAATPKQQQTSTIHMGHHAFDKFLTSTPSSPRQALVPCSPIPSYSVEHSS